MIGGSSYPKNIYGMPQFECKSKNRFEFKIKFKFEFKQKRKEKRKGKGGEPSHLGLASASRPSCCSVPLGALALTGQARLDPLPC